jgi:CheY-like chemotaxis protein
MKDAARSGHRGARRLQILLVDDNEVLRTAILGLLRLMGHSIDVARNGREALEATARHAYDVVLMDVQMPEMGGFEAARSLRRDSPGDRTPRIIGVSGESTDRECYVAAGMDDFLTKPVRPRDLARVLHAPVDGGWLASRIEGDASPCQPASGGESAWDHSGL